MSDREKKPEDDDTPEQKKAGKSKPVETPRFGAFEADPAQKAAPSEDNFVLHINSVWKNRLQGQIKTFLDRFFNAFTQFLEQNVDFVEMLRHFDKLFDDLSWGGFRIIQDDGFEVDIFYTQFNFEINGKPFVLDVEMSDPSAFQGAAFMGERNTLQTLLYEYLSDHSDAVHAFPETAHEIKDQIQKFNPTQE